jgi:hypothetical protein
VSASRGKQQQQQRRRRRRRQQQHAFQTLHFANIIIKLIVTSRRMLGTGCSYTAAAAAAAAAAADNESTPGP